MIDIATDRAFYNEFSTEPVRMVPDGQWFLEDGDEQLYFGGPDVTDEDVNDLMRRSLAAGRNLFLEEWELDDSEPDPLICI